MRQAIFGCLLLAATFSAGSLRAQAATHDGNWSVLIVTEQGACDRAYKYDVRIKGGQVRHDGGDPSFQIDGEVDANGSVRVGVSRGSQKAIGSGRLSASAGAGTWRGHGQSGDCAGRWEAERR